MANPTRLSRPGAELIANFEGYRGTVYRDAVGIPTIGYGHVVRPGEHFGFLSRQAALALLQRDATAAAHAVHQAVRVQLSQNQFDALVSFVFNVGAGAFRSSTLLRKLNNGDYQGAADQFGAWTHAGGRVLPGLVTRRNAEAAMFRRKPPKPADPLTKPARYHVDLAAHKLSTNRRGREIEWLRDQMRDIQHRARAEKDGWRKRHRGVRYQLLGRALKTAEAKR
jgi:lysozyme